MQVRYETFTYIDVYTERKARTKKQVSAFSSCISYEKLTIDKKIPHSHVPCVCHNYMNVYTNSFCTNINCFLTNLCILSCVYSMNLEKYFRKYNEKRIDKHSIHISFELCLTYMSQPLAQASKHEYSQRDYMTLPRIHGIQVRIYYSVYWNVPIYKATMQVSLYNDKKKKSPSNTPDFTSFQCENFFHFQ